MFGRDGADAHERRGDRDVGLLGEFDEFRARVGADDSAAAINHRSLALLDEPGNLVHRDVANLLIRIVAAQQNLVWEYRLAVALLDVLRDVNPDRARSSRGRNVKRLFDDARDVLDIHHEVTVLHDW